MVKSPQDPAMDDPLTVDLREIGRELGQVQAKPLIQHTPVYPLQLHDSNRITDPVLLPIGARVAVLTDPFGQAATAIAATRPHWQVTGWVGDTKTFMNLQRHETAANLSFDKQPKTLPAAEKFDAILAVGWAHRVLSEAQYNVNALIAGLRDLLVLVPENGQLLIQDFYLPEQADKFILLEIEQAETAAALLAFSQQVRPHAPKVMQGFFIERLSAPEERVQKFHLPLKWAVEFYHRWRLGIAMDAPFELTTLSPEQWTALIEQCGARVAYRAPHALPRAETKDIQRDLRFMDDHGQRTPLPPGSFTLVVEKIAATGALQCYEHHVSRESVQNIVVSEMARTETDPPQEKMGDMVEIRTSEDDLLPWYRDEQDRLHVLVRGNVSRPVINAVARGTPNLDGRFWAGYLIEPIAVPHFQGEIDQQILHEIITTETGIPQNKMGPVQISAEYYPAPEYLAQRVRGILLPLKGSPVFHTPMKDGSRIMDVLADDVLRAISAGLIPDGKLEILIGGLMQEMGVFPRDIAPSGEKMEAVRATRIIKDRFEVKPRRTAKSGEHLMEFLAETPAEKLRAVRSVFVEDRMTDYGRHIANYVEQEFIVASNLSGNSAVCIPLVHDVVKGLMMSGSPRKLPIPSRMGSSEPLLNLPGFSLPATVRTMDDARIFLAKQLGCEADDLHVMGPSFFVHPQISAERVYPFLLTAPPVGLMRNRWFKPRSSGLRRRLSPHVEKTAAYIEYKFGRDMGEWYTGFTPEIINHLTVKTGPASHNDNMAAPAEFVPPPLQPKML